MDALVSLLSEAPSGSPVAEGWSAVGWAGVALLLLALVRWGDLLVPRTLRRRRGAPPSSRDRRAGPRRPAKRERRDDGIPRAGAS